MQVPVNVNLASDEIVDCWKFARDIAKAVCPSIEDARGIDCVAGKTAHSAAIGIELPYYLTAGDREQLGKLLPALPELRYPMSGEQVNEFMDAYRLTDNRPDWEPVFIKESDIWANRQQQWNIFDRHFAALQTAFSDGQIAAFDQYHAPAERIALGALMSRKHAVEYLERCGLTFSTAVDSKSSNCDSNPGSPGGSDTVSTPVAGDADSDAFWRGGTQKRWTDELMMELAQYHELCGTAGAAKQFNVSESRIREVLRNWREKQGQKATPFSGLMSR
ncbi:hypothetical protein [Paraburkholderia sp.]|uniref:hypothetical protein n=1 Tax=Paraburkholderia sp. TaxID=1926495 RepID=UPI003C7B24AC